MNVFSNSGTVRGLTLRHVVGSANDMVLGDTATSRYKIEHAARPCRDGLHGEQPPASKLNTG
eukprot:435849-Rhodomonas_salina.1